MKTFFLGSSDYSIPSLKALVAAGMAPALVVTKPDAPRGRGRKIYPAELRLAAEELGLPCEQPADPHDPEFLELLRQHQLELGIVVSYGVVLNQELLNLTPKGYINAHASLLPLYRGAAPIQHAIRDGRETTGVTVMKLEQELDSGPVLFQHETAIGERETAGELRQRLAELSGEVLVKAVKLIEADKDSYTAQDHSKATRAPKVCKPDGVISWDQPAEKIGLLVRAMTPKPGAQTRLGAKRFIVIQGEVETDFYGMGITGGIQSAGEEGIRVCTGKDLYRITRIKPDNGRNMTAGEFVRGHPLPPDARFG